MAAANITAYPTGKQPKKAKRPAAKKAKGKSKAAAMPESPSASASDEDKNEDEGEGESECEGEGEAAGDSEYEGEGDNEQPSQSEDELFDDDEENEGSDHAPVAPVRNKKAACSEPAGEREREPMEKDPAPPESRAQYVARRVGEIRLESKGVGEKRKRGGGGLRLTPDEIAGAEFDEMDIQGNGARKRRMGAEALLACQGHLRASLRASRKL